MYTTVLLAALSSLPTADAGEAHAWLTDYHSAHKEAVEAKKPLAVFFGAGKDGQLKVAREGKLDKDADRLLAEHYVCVHVDSASPAGRQLAAAFEVKSGTGLVISDRTGKYQAFSHDGDLGGFALVRHLKKYADPDHVVKTTETNAPVVRTANYPPASPAPVNIGMFGNMGGGRGGC